VLRKWLAWFIGGIPFFPLFIYKLDKTKVTAEHIKATSVNRILNQIIPAHLSFSSTKVFAKDTFISRTNNLFDILPIGIEIIRSILILIRIIQMQEIPNHKLTVLTDFDFIFLKTKDFSTASKRTSITSTDPMNMSLFKLTFIIDVHIMQTESPLLEFRLNAVNHFIAVVRFRVRIQDTGEVTNFLISHRKAPTFQKFGNRQQRLP